MYILRSQKSGRYYVGATEQLPRRILEHNTPDLNPSRWTRDRGPWDLVYSREFATVRDVRVAEAFIKRMKSRRYIEKPVSGEYTLPPDSGAGAPTTQ